MRAHVLLVCILAAGCGIDVQIGAGDDDTGTVCVQDCERARVFVQESRVDLLVVLDNSASMGEEHARLAEGFADLLQHTVRDRHDLHLGVLTTDLEAGGARLLTVDGARWADSEDPDAALAWLEAAVDAAGIDGSTEERVRAVVQQALADRSEDHNAGFRRDDAHLAILILSDEDDGSGEAPSLDAFVDWIDGAWGIERVTTHAIVGLQPEPCVGAEGREHVALVELTGGTSLSVCELDYGPYLAGVGQFVALEGLGTRFALGPGVMPASVEVEVRYPSGFVDRLDPSQHTWSAADHAVVLLSPPPAGSEIQIRYRLGAGG